MAVKKARLVSDVTDEEALAPTHVVRRHLQGERMLHPGDLVLAEEWTNCEALERLGFIKPLVTDISVAAARSQARAEIRLRELAEAEERDRQRLAELEQERQSLKATIEEMERILREGHAKERLLASVEREIGGLREGLGDRLAARRAQIEGRRSTAAAMLRGSNAAYGAE